MNKANTLSCRCPGSHRPQVSSHSQGVKACISSCSRWQTADNEWMRQTSQVQKREEVGWVNLQLLICQRSDLKPTHTCVGEWTGRTPVFVIQGLDLHIHNPFVQVQDLMDGDQNKAFQTSPALTCSKPSSYVLSLTQQSLAIYLNRLTYQTLLPSKLHPYSCPFSPFCKHLGWFDLLSFSWVMLAGLWDI